MADMADLAPIIRTLETELVEVRGQLSTALGDLYERGEELTRARNQIAHRDRQTAQLTAERDQARNQLTASSQVSEHLASQVMTLTIERNRARDVAVALEQELATVTDWQAKAIWPDGLYVPEPDGPGELDRILAEAAAADRIAEGAALDAERRGDTPPPSWTVASGMRSTVDPETGVTWVTMPDGGPIEPPTVDAGEVIASGVPIVLFTDHGPTLSERLVELGRQELAERGEPGAYDSSGEPHPFEGTDEACRRCGLIFAAPYHHQDNRRPAVAPGQWVRILERPAGLPAGQIGKVLPPGFTPPSTPASRVIAVKTGPGHPVDAVAWETIDPPAGTHEHQESDTDG